MFDDTERNPFTRGGGGILLTAVVHTASFIDPILAHDPLIERLLRLSKNRYRVVWTPTEDEDVRSALRRARWSEIGEYEVNDEWLVLTTPMPAPVRHRVKYIGDWTRPSVAGSRVTVLDELFTHPLAVDLFVVAGDDPFLKRDSRRRCYVCPEDAFNLIRVLEANLDPNDSSYFHFRAAKLFPAADLPRVAMTVTREHGFPNELREQIESFRQRIQLILRAADRVAYHALRRPDGRAAGKCSYHLGYFIVLVTGLFDELAWTIAQRYRLKVAPRQTVLRRRPKDDVFFSAIRTENDDLHAFLSDRDTQRVIRLFYPARDQLQHRALLPTRLVEDPAPTRVLAELPVDTLSEIHGLSRSGGVDWGVVEGSVPGYVDPYLFTLAAVHAIAEVANGVLRRLEWERYVDLLPEELRAEKREYFATEIGTAPLTRFASHPEPPYY